MKPILTTLAVAVVLVVTPGRSDALWGLAPVTKELAKELSMEVRTSPAGPNHVRVELEFKTDGRLKDFGWVDLRFGQSDNPPLTAALREDRTKAGRVAVSFTADRARLAEISLWVMVPEPLGGTAYTRG